MAKEKDQSIETLRGIAIMLVVAGYIIRDDLGGEGRTAISSGLNFLYYCLRPIRMPLFTVISGFLYGAFPATKETFKKLVMGKMRRILIPFAVISAVQYAFYSLVPNKVPHPLHKIYSIYLYPLDQFWFLYSIFWIFILMGILDACKLLETPRKWMAALIIALLCNAAFEPTQLFSINGVNYLLPFFLLGYGIQRFPKKLFTLKKVFSYLGIMAIAYVPYFLQYWRHPTEGSELIHKIISLSISCTAVPLLFYYRKNVPQLAKIGYYSFGIHIFNKIAIAFPRAAFHRFHVQNDGMIFLTFFVCSIIFSIGLQTLMEQFVFTRKYVLGLRDSGIPSSPKDSGLKPAPETPVPIPPPVLQPLMAIETSSEAKVQPSL